MDSLYSAMIIEAEGSYGGVPWRLFEYGRSQPIAGSQQYATAAHTNVPRSSVAGLPMDHEFWITQWRCGVNLRYAESVLDWASETEIKFHYNNRVIRTSPLIDLMMAPQPFAELEEESDDPGAARRPPRIQAFRINENISWRVEITSPVKSVEKLQRWLVEHTTDGKLICWIWFDGRHKKGVTS